MKIAVAGSKNWSNYNELMRQLTLIIEDQARLNPDDDKITFIHSGAVGAEDMITEYVGKVSSYMKQKGYIVKDEVFRPNNTESIPGYRSSRDNALLEQNVDKAIVFIKDSCKRTEAFARLAKAHEIPTIIVKG